jgi:hypothetical protein
MNHRLIVLVLVFAAAASAVAAPLGTSARTAIPSNVQQIISVDYRALKSSDSGMALKARVLPDALKEFEKALKGMSIDPDKDVEQLAFVAFRTKDSLASIGLAQGNFDPKKFVGKDEAQKDQGDQVSPERHLPLRHRACDQHSRSVHDAVRRHVSGAESPRCCATARRNH